MISFLETKEDSWIVSQLSPAFKGTCVFRGRGCVWGKGMFNWKGERVINTYYRNAGMGSKRGQCYILHQAWENSQLLDFAFAVKDILNLNPVSKN